MGKWFLQHFKSVFLVKSMRHRLTFSNWTAALNKIHDGIVHIIPSSGSKRNIHITSYVMFH